MSLYSCFWRRHCVGRVVVVVIGALKCGSTKYHLFGHSAIKDRLACGEHLGGAVVYL